MSPRCEYTKVCKDDIESKYTSVGVDKSHLLEEEVEKEPTNKSPKKRSCIKRCLFISLYVLLTLTVLALGIGAIAYAKVAAVVKKWTTTYSLAKGTFPPADTPWAQSRVLLDEGKLFADLILADQEPDDFVLTAANINGLAFNSDYLRDNFYVEIVPDEIKATHSLPMDFLPGGRGRFLDGEMTMSYDKEQSIFHMKMEPLHLSSMPKQPYLDFSLLVGLDEEGQGLSSLTLLSGQFLDWSVSEDFIKERKNLLDIAKDGCGHHHGHSYHRGHSYHNEDGHSYHHEDGHDDHHHHHDKHDHRHDHGHHNHGDRHRHGHHHHPHGDVKADVLKVLAGIKRVSIEKGQVVFRAHSSDEEVTIHAIGSTAGSPKGGIAFLKPEASSSEDEEYSFPAHLSSEEEDVTDTADVAHRKLMEVSSAEKSYGNHNILSTAFHIYQNIVRI